MTNDQKHRETIERVHAIAEANAAYVDAGASGGKYGSLAAYATNVLDTLRDEGISPGYRERALERFLLMATKRIDLA